MAKGFILLVNDNSFINRMVQRQLEGWGFTDIVTASTGEEAIALTAHQRIDLVIADIYMPHIDGWQLCRLLKSEEYPKLNEVPVLLISATFKDQTAEQLAWDVGAFAFLQVPYDEEDLHTLVLSRLAPEQLTEAARKKIGTRGRVLVADDTVTVVHALTECLEREGYEVFGASDGTEAIKIAERHRPDVLFVDYQMPRINGMRVLKWVRANYPDAMVIMITAHGSEQLAADLMRAGAEDYLRKPFEIAEIPPLVARAFRKLNLRRINRQFQEKMDHVQMSEEKYRNLFEKSVDPIALIDLESGRFLEVNRGFEELTGYRRDEITRLRLEDLAAGPAADVVARGFADLRKLGQQRIEEAGLKRRGGAVVPVDVSASIVEYGGKRVVQAFVRDLTHTKHLREQLIQSEKLSSIGQLVSGVAHEINNPLTGIIGFSQMLAEKADLSPEVQEDLGKIYREARRCQKIVGNLLKFARAEKVKRGAVRVNTLLDETLSLKEYAFKVSNIVIQREYEPGLPAIVGDPYRLQQVFINIVNNAHDAMQEHHGWGTLTVRTSLVEDRTRIEFLDDGPGMEDPRKVFDPFYTTKEVGKGTGLGLSLSYGIIKEHGGEILAENREGGGARFVVDLPVGDIDSVSVAIVPPPMPSRGNGEAILVVDDEEVVLDVSEKILAEANYKIETARSGAEALHKIGTTEFDLILTDLRMPGEIHGIDLYRWVKENRPGREARIVFVTGDTVRGETRSFLDSVPNLCLAKPFSIESLQETVKKALDRVA